MTPFIATYPLEILPTGFTYPTEYLCICLGKEDAQINPAWWLIDGQSDAGRLIFSVRHTDSRNLIPFAKSSIEDDVVCFDGDDRMGDPQVHFLDLEGSGRRYSHANFREWLAVARTQAAKLKNVR